MLVLVQVWIGKYRTTSLLLPDDTSDEQTNI